MQAPTTTTRKPTLRQRKPILPIEPPDADRFWSLVAQSSGCWLWTGVVDAYGYGAFPLVRERRIVYLRAPRVAYALSHGVDPGALEVCHNCPDGDNPACVNPDHLWLGRHLDNMRDCVRKGRARGGVRGERNPGARLTEQQVLDIRRRRQAGEGAAALARAYGITDAAVRMIVTRRTWKHI